MKQSLYEHPQYQQTPTPLPDHDMETNIQPGPIHADFEDEWDLLDDIIILILMILIMIGMM